MKFGHEVDAHRECASPAVYRSRHRWRRVAPLARVPSCLRNGWDAPVLLLDEATSSVSRESGHLVQQTLDKTAAPQLCASACDRAQGYRILAMEGVGSSSRGTQPTRCKEIASTLHSQLCSSTVRMAGSKVSPRFGVLGCFRSTQDSRRRERMRDREPVRGARLRLSSCG